jgi:anti-sigma factor RsiW
MEVNARAMDCREFQKQIGEYPDRETSQQERESLEAHASACPVCAGDLRVFKAMREGFDTLPPLGASAGFEERLSRRLSRETSRDPVPVLAFPVWARRAALAAAAAIVLGFAALMLLNDGGSRGIRGDIAVNSQTAPAKPASEPGGTVGIEGGSGQPAGAPLRGGEIGVADVASTTPSKMPAAERAGLDQFLSKEGVPLVPAGSGSNYVIDRPSDLPLLLPGGVEGEAASTPIEF